MNTRKIIIMVVLFVFCVTSYSYADTWAGANASLLQGSGVWESGSGTAKVIKIPVKYTAPMINGSGTIKKWGLVGLTASNINPFLGILVTGGLMIGTYYFDKWLNDRTINRDGLGYFVEEPSENGGTVTPTSGHVAWLYISGSWNYANMGYFHSSAEALAAAQAYGGYIGTAGMNNLALTSVWNSKVCSTTISGIIYRKHFFYPVSGTPYTEGVEGGRDDISEAEIIEMLKESIEKSSEITGAVKQFLELHEPSINHYLTTGTLLPDSSLSESVIEDLADVFKSTADAITRASFNALDYPGAPSVDEINNPYTPEDVGSVTAEDISVQIDEKARALQAENDAAAEVKAQEEIQTLNDIVPEFDATVDIPVKDDPWWTGLFESNAAVQAIKNSGLSASGACSFSFAVFGQNMVFTVCPYQDALQAWGVIMQALAGLTALLIVFRR